MLAISQIDINKIINWAEIVQVIEQAFAALSTGKANIPLRSTLSVPDYAGALLTMPGFVGAGEETEAGLAVKLVSVFEGNPARQLPLIHGLVILLDATSGRPLALFEGGHLTALRTGAASGVATKHLARDNAAIVALFGAGVQAVTQLQAVCAVRQVSEIRVYSRTPERTASFSQQMQAVLNIPVKAVDSPNVAVSGADIVITATTSPTPVFADAELAPGVHINGIGSYRPEMREVPGDTVSRAVVVVDAREGCLAEAGDLLIPLKEGKFVPEQIYAELGEICAGLKPGRAALGTDTITFFKSVGNAVQDVALARYLYAKAQQMGLGQRVNL